MLRYMTDRARPGLVALYDIRPGNGAGPFLQPGARTGPPLEKNPAGAHEHNMVKPVVCAMYMTPQKLSHLCDGLLGQI